MEYRYRVSQDELKRIYENAKGRKNAHPEFAEKQYEIIQACPYFETEKEALEAAIKIEKENPYSCQIWAKIEKFEDIYRIQNYWVVTDDVKVKVAADYIEMAQMYDEARLSKIINSNVKIDDVIAYY